MKGSVYQEKDRGRWAVSFRWKGRARVIRKYKGEWMYHRKIAEKCLALIQGRYEQSQHGLCTFRIEEFTKPAWSDVEEFFITWMKDVVEPNRKPGTIKGYWSYWNRHLKPFFDANPIQLHEIQLDTLVKLKNGINLSGKGIYNVVNCLHSMMDHAYRSNRISSMPPFPKKEDYDLRPREISWLNEEDQMRVIMAIPDTYRAIFLWLKYHYRRPSEACALQWRDWDEINGVFTVCRTYSNRELVETTKTRDIHYIPADPEFLQLVSLDRGNARLDDFIFQNPRARKRGGYYPEALNKIWNKACKKIGVQIELYEGTKHSSCCQFINEYEGTIDELQMLTGHARRDSVEHYAAIGVERKRRLMARRLQNDSNRTKSHLKVVK